jgi:hypothetical protein
VPERCGNALVSEGVIWDQQLPRAIQSFWDMQEARSQYDAEKAISSASWSLLPHY